jgi:WLM domain
MATTGPPGPRPAWYRRLPPSLQRVAAASDRVSALPLHPGPALLEAVAQLPAALQTEQVATVEAVSQQIADGVCRALGVSPLRVRIDGQRPHDQRGELHGLYLPANGTGRDRITLWMRTAKRGQIVAYRTFLRTLLHELCHHLDYTYLRLKDSLHTQGFYQRESSLFAALGGPSSDGEGRDPMR